MSAVLTDIVLAVCLSVSHSLLFQPQQVLCVRRGESDLQADQPVRRLLPEQRVPRPEFHAQVPRYALGSRRASGEG